MYKRLLVAVLALLPSLAWGNDYYTHGSFPATGSAATSAGMRAELDLVTAGFDKMPALTGNASRAVIVNGAGTALSLTTGTLTLPGNFALSGANNVTLTTTGATNVTLPTTGTLGTLAGVESPTNKTIDLASNTLTGTLAQFNAALSGADFLSVAGVESPTNKTIDLANNTLTGTLAQFNTALSGADFATLAGAETLSGPKTLASPILSGTPVFPDNVFTIGGSSDATKKIAIEVDGLTTGTTRTWIAQDASGTVAFTNTADTWSTGDVKLTLKTSADSGWVLMNDGTIGSATSGASTRANADTATLYTLIYNNCVDQWCAVTGGRGANAAADFAANKPLALPKTLGRALAGYGTGVVTAAGSDAGVDLTNDTFTVDSNNTKWITGMPVVFTLSSGTITGLTSGNTYYIIRDSTTTVKLASSLANAQNGTEVNMTAKSSPVWTLTHTYTARALGEAVGEEAHAMSVTELLAHTHAMSAVQNIAGAVVAAGSDKGTSANTGSKGGNVAMNQLQPTSFFNVMVKL